MYVIAVANTRRRGISRGGGRVQLRALSRDSINTYA